MASNDDFYLDLVATVNDVLNQFGKVLEVRVPGKYNPDTLMADDPDVLHVLGVVATGQQAVQMLVMANNTAQIVNGRYVILSPDYELNQDMTLIIDGCEYSMTKLEIVRPADITVCYMLSLGA